MMLKPTSLMLPRASRSGSSSGVIARAAGQESTTQAALTTTARYNNVGPDPKRFSVGEGQLLQVAAASVPALMRAGSGALCVGYKTEWISDDDKYGVVKSGGRKLHETSKVTGFPRPAKPLQLYEFEPCPFCKKVREAISLLDLDVEMFPCPKDGDVWRPKANFLGGKKQFPYLVDPNTGISMYESDDIIAYLFRTYGDGEVPRLLRPGFITNVTAGLGSIFRIGKGGKARPSRQPEQPLVFWGYEGSPFVKLAREVLCEMQIPYVYRNVARGSPKRDEMFQKYGHFQVPFLEDPNTNSCLWESAAIIRYLKHTYGTSEEASSQSSTTSA